MSDIESFIEVVKTGDVALIDSILKNQPDLANAKTKQNLSVLLLAAYYNHTEVVKIMLQYKTHFNIFEAAGTGRLNEVQKHVASGASINAFAPDGFTALGLACFFGHQEVVDFLLKEKADVNIPSNNDFKVAPLHSAVAKKSIPIAKMLLEAGANVNARQTSGVTALHSAVHNGQLDMVQLLLERGADISSTMEDGRTPLSMAEEENFTEIITILKNS